MQKIPDQFLTISKAENDNREVKAMSIADAFTADFTAEYARKIVEIETRGNGDQLNALERAGRRCGMSARALRRLINGETKDPGISIFGKVRKAYLDLCESQINKLIHEVEADKKRFGDAAFADIGEEVQALAEKLRRAKEGA
jgi:hypothetical protein